MKKILKFLQGIENIIMLVTFAIMVFASFAQVVNRNFFKLPITWFEEAAVYSMIYMVLIGTEIGLRDGTQVAVTAVVDKLGGKFRSFIEIISKAIVVIFSATIFYSSMGMLQMQIRTGQTSPALKLPMSIPYAAITVSFGIIAIVQGAVLLLMILNFNKEKGAK
ncbi:MAG: TRAP transporter small permease [Fusobacterium sp.]|uniref:TRAP transporter small permease n=1 Tax=Fusobacterium sp. TaxID=68766 RepID=UPI002942A462|nr:TRAP transporter small permease [Fusobacterium sp.]MDY3059917.1 TRAP transporter small permease [Fusobacterium sp.]